MTMEPAVFAAVVVVATLTVMFCASILADRVMTGMLRVARGKPARRVEENHGNDNG